MPLEPRASHLHLKTRLANFAHNILGPLLFPTLNACHVCDKALSASSPEGLCATCQAQLRSESLLPFAIHSRHEPLMDCVSAFAYRDVARKLVHAVKFDSDALAVLPLGEGMAQVLAQSGFMEKIDIIVPVPVSAARLRDRGYNQAELLAREVGLHTQIPLQPKALTRVIDHGTQISRTRNERLQAMHGAFQADAEIVSGKNLLVIDDVLTTGATAVACAEALLAVKAQAVYLLTACRA